MLLVSLSSPNYPIKEGDWIELMQVVLTELVLVRCLPVTSQILANELTIGCSTRSHIETKPADLQFSSSCFPSRSPTSP